MFDTLILRKNSKLLRISWLMIYW